MKKIVFAFLLPLFLLSGCIDSSSSQLETLVQEQREIQNQQSSYFSLMHVESNKYALVLNNPKKLAIQSVKFSFTYPEHLAEITDFEVVGANEAFPLLLEMGDSKAGLQSVSMAQEGKAKELDEVIVLAEFTVKKKSDSPFQFDFFNGKTGNSIMAIEEGKLINLLDIDKLQSLTVL